MSRKRLHSSLATPHRKDQDCRRPAKIKTGNLNHGSPLLHGNALDTVDEWFPSTGRRAVHFTCNIYSFCHATALSASRVEFHIRHASRPCVRIGLLLPSRFDPTHILTTTHYHRTTTNAFALSHSDTMAISPAPNNTTAPSRRSQRLHKAPRLPLPDARQPRHSRTPAHGGTAARMNKKPQPQPQPQPEASPSRHPISNRSKLVSIRLG